jgi:aminomethyltransferase
LHGSDIDPTTNPLEAGLGRFVKLDKDFVAAELLRKQNETGIARKLVGLLSVGRSIPRHDHLIKNNDTTVGKITSGGYSPTLDRNIALGYVSQDFTTVDQHLTIDIRGRLTDAVVSTLPFYARKKKE